MADEQIKMVEELARELVDYRDQKKQCEEALKDINKKIKDVEEKKLADLLDELQISKITLDDMDIKRTCVFHGGYTKHTDKEAFQFLFDSNNDGALKKHIIIDMEACQRASIELDVAGIPYQIEYSIHHATLSSILKELVESGKFSTDDMDKYSVYVQPQVKIKTK